MNIIPLAAESLGSRSMATFVATEDCTILMDPGCEKAEYRFGLKAHPLELYCWEKHLDLIRVYARDAEVIFLSHYHASHFRFPALEYYNGKILFIKNPNQHIDTRQRRLAFAFLKDVRSRAKEIHYIDSLTRTIGKTRLVFSEPVGHGGAEGAGFVVQCMVEEEGRRFVFSPDVYGLQKKDSLTFILRQNPEILYMDGPDTSTVRPGAAGSSLEESISRLREILQKTGMVTMILDHHVIRDPLWKEKMLPVFDMALLHGITIHTAAEYRGDKTRCLEAIRDKLYRDEPPE